MNAEMKRVLDTGIKVMVDRFLGWKLPDNFNPDNGITFQRHGNEGTPQQYKRELSGTNLFDAQQAEAMVRHIVNVTENEKTQPVKARHVITAERLMQIKFLMEAIEWLEHYPDTQEHDHGHYLDSEDVDFADKIAAYLAVQLKEMPSDA